MGRDHLCSRPPLTSYCFQNRELALRLSEYALFIPRAIAATVAEPIPAGGGRTVFCDLT